MWVGPSIFILLLLLLCWGSCSPPFLPCLDWPVNNRPRCEQRHCVASLARACNLALPRRSPLPLLICPAGQFAASTVSQLQRLFQPRKRQGPLRWRARAMAVMATATGIAALGAAVLLGQLQHDQRLQYLGALYG